MPPGHVHYKIWKGTLIFIPIAAAIVYYAALYTRSFNPVISALGVLIGGLLGRWIDPDLDLIGITNSESRMMRDLKLFGALLTAWWIPYSYLMRFVGIGKKGHRNFFSHFPGVSTLIRMLWLAAFPPFSFGAYWLMDHFTPPPWLTPYGSALALGIFVGLTVTDTTHYIADMRS